MFIYIYIYTYIHVYTCIYIFIYIYIGRMIPHKTDREDYFKSWHETEPHWGELKAMAGKYFPKQREVIQLSYELNWKSFIGLYQSFLASQYQGTWYIHSNIIVGGVIPRVKIQCQTANNVSGINVDILLWHRYSNYYCVILVCISESVITTFVIARPCPPRIYVYILYTHTHTHTHTYIYIYIICIYWMIATATVTPQQEKKVYLYQLIEIWILNIHICQLTTQHQ